MSNMKKNKLDHCNGKGTLVEFGLYTLDQSWK